MFDIKENLKKLPDAPGVYLHKDKLGQVIYVGKAISLKKRVSQYFQNSSKHSPKVRAMVENIEEFEYIIVASEMEALILECNLIKKYAPKYNILLRDDKSYPYIEITYGEKFPRILKTRRIDKKKSKYFGPYSDAGAVTQIIELLMDVYQLKRCNMRTFPKNFRPCLNFHIDKCKGICTGNVDREAYLNDLLEVQEFLSGKTAKLRKILKENMEKASESLDFERAAKIRDQIFAIDSINETQRASIVGIKDIDIIIGLKTREKSYAVLFLVREGKLIQRDYFVMQGATDRKEIVSEFIKQYYIGNINLPYQILVEEEFEEMGLFSEILSKNAERKVEIYVPKKGSKADLLKLAKNDSVELKSSIDLKEKNKRERAENIKSELDEIIKKIKGEDAKLLPNNYRVEAYDISNTNGIDSVGGMVVFRELSAEKKSYRRFKIRTVEGSNDYASMQEVLYRRLRAAREGASAFTTLPQLILLDGGKGQVSAVLPILAALRLDIPVVGMAKDTHHRTRALVYKPEKPGNTCIQSQSPIYDLKNVKKDFSEIQDEKKGKSGKQSLLQIGDLKVDEDGVVIEDMENYRMDFNFSDDDFEELELKDHPLLFKYIGWIQEEVHRFSIDYHKKLRDKHIVSSVLDEIEGIGKTRRMALLSHFGSIEAIKVASEEELAEVPGMSRKAAKAVATFFKRQELKF